MEVVEQKVVEQKVEGTCRRYWHYNGNGPNYKEAIVYVSKKCVVIHYSCHSYSVEQSIVFEVICAYLYSTPAYKIVLPQAIRVFSRGDKDVYDEVGFNIDDQDVPLCCLPRLYLFFLPGSPFSDDYLDIGGHGNAGGHFDFGGAKMKDGAHFGKHVDCMICENDTVRSEHDACLLELRCLQLEDVTDTHDVRAYLLDKIVNTDDAATSREQAMERLTPWGDKDIASMPVVQCAQEVLIDAIIQRWKNTPDVWKNLHPSSTDVGAHALSSDGPSVGVMR